MSVTERAKVIRKWSITHNAELENLCSLLLMMESTMKWSESFELMEVTRNAYKMLVGLRRMRQI
jgi:hypothetical protein